MTADGRVRVVGQEVLASQVLVETENRVRKLISLADIIDGPDSPATAGRNGDSIERPRTVEPTADVYE
jgi:hypothetical protein